MRGYFDSSREKPQRGDQTIFLLESRKTSKGWPNDIFTRVEKNLKGGTKGYFCPGLDGIKGDKPASSCSTNVLIIKYEFKIIKANELIIRLINYIYS